MIDETDPQAQSLDGGQDIAALDPVAPGRTWDCGDFALAILF